MANPTTNFGWVMPTSTDLVTDLPADFNVFGQGVDTSMQFLLGGTTGQVLSKTSATNMAFTWVTPTDQTPLTTKGDLFSFTTVDARLGVGANETRLVADSAQATGLKYVADTTNYAIAAKGDLLGGTAADTLQALSVGTNNQVLTADSAQATGMKWATPSSGALTLITTQTFTTAASQSVNTCFSSSYTNYKIVVTLTTASADAMVSLNLRTGSTDTSSTQNYSYYSGWSTQPGSINNVANGGVTSLQLFQTDSGYTAPAYAMSMDMYNPNVSSNTTPTWNAQFAQSSNSWLAAVVGGSFTNTTDQFDGFTLKISAGTMSGKAWVYGYSN